jgi:hypothetical protein
VKSRRLWWIGHVERVANTMNILRILMGKFFATGSEKEIGDMLRCVLGTSVLRMGDDV